MRLGYIVAPLGSLQLSADLFEGLGKHAELLVERSSCLDDAAVVLLTMLDFPQLIDQRQGEHQVRRVDEQHTLAEGLVGKVLVLLHSKNVTALIGHKHQHRRHGIGD